MSKDHYVPRSLLKNFSHDGNGKSLFFFDKRNAKVFGSSIADAGSENHFNTATIAGKRVSFEGAFDASDSRLASLLGQLLRNEKLAGMPAMDRKDFAGLALLQLFRAKINRLTTVHLPEMLRQHIEEAYGPVSETVLPRINENDAKLSNLLAMSDAEKYLPSLMSKYWGLHRAPDEYPFWISDNPVVVVNVFPYGDFGLSSQGVEVCWPLSSRFLISFSCPTIAAKVAGIHPLMAECLRREVTIPCRKENVDFYNSLQVMQSSRYLYGASQDFDLARQIVEQHPEVRHVESRMKLTKIGEVPHKEQMPEGEFLVVYGAKSHYMLPLLKWDHIDGGMQIQVKQEVASDLKFIAEDKPHSLVEIYADKFACVHIKHARITIDQSTPNVAVVDHVDPALRAMFKK